MRGFPKLVSAAAVVILPARATPTADNDTKNVKFLPDVVGIDCTQDLTPCIDHWWTTRDATGTALYYTAGGDTSLEFTFKGGQVTLYGRKLSSGGNATLILDNGSPSTINFKLVDGTESDTIWQQGSLDKTATHTIQLSYQAPIGVAPKSFWPIVIESFEVDGIAAQRNAQADPQGNPQADSDDSDRVISLAAGLSGGFALLLSILACAFYWYRRRQQARPQYENVHPLQLGSRDPEYAAGGGYPPSRGPSMRNFPGNIDPFILAEARPSTSQITTRSATPQQVYHLHTTSSTALLPIASHGPSPVPSSVPRQSSSHHHLHRPNSQEQQRPRPHVDTAPAPSEPPERPWMLSPTETTHSYESWTSSDFGPVPSPFIANGPPVPPVPPHLASSVEKGQWKGRTVRTARQSNATTLPPYTEKVEKAR